MWHNHLSFKKFERFLFCLLINIKICITLFHLILMTWIIYWLWWLNWLMKTVMLIIRIVLSRLMMSSRLYLRLNMAKGMDIYTDHCINGTNKLYIVLSLLFSGMIVHDFSTDGLNISTIQPLVKNKCKSLNDSSNFRAVALSSPVAKIFYWVILNTNTDKFCTSDLQYGFKAKSSAT